MKTTIYLKSVFTALVLTLAFGVCAYAATSVADLSSKDIGSSETTLGNLVTDAIRAQVKADVALITASELKETIIPKGDISAKDVASAITYQNDPIVVLKLRGDQIRQALERGVAIYPQKNLGFLQVSGLRFAFDPTKPKESRITSVAVGAKSLDPSAIYTVGVSSSLGNGALGYFRIWDKEQITSVTKTSLSQAVETFLQTNKKLEYKTDRITVFK